MKQYTGEQHTSTYRSVEVHTFRDHPADSILDTPDSAVDWHMLSVHCDKHLLTRIYRPQRVACPYPQRSSTQNMAPSGHCQFNPPVLNLLSRRPRFDFRKAGRSEQMANRKRDIAGGESSRESEAMRTGRTSSPWSTLNRDDGRHRGGNRGFQALAPPERRQHPIAARLLRVGVSGATVPLGGSVSRSRPREARALRLATRGAGGWPSKGAI